MLASVFLASLAVFAFATKGIIVGERKPMIALSINWSCRIQRLCAGFGVVLLSFVRVAVGKVLYHRHSREDHNQLTRSGTEVSRIGN